MSTNQRERRGGAVNYGQASTRSRLLASSEGGPSTAEPTDLEESGVLSSVPAVGEIIDLTRESPEPEVIDLTGDDSVGQQEQNQENPLVSSTADNSVVLPVNDDEEEPRDNNGPTANITSVLYQDCFLWQQEQNQENPLVSSSADNSVVLPVNDDEEEPRDNDGSLFFSIWPPNVSPPVWIDEYSEWEQNQEYPPVSSAADLLLVNDDEEESTHDDSTWAAGDAENSQLLQGYEQQRNQRLLDIPAPSSDDEDETSGSEQRGSRDQETPREWQAAVRCPICMDFYSQIVQRGRHVVSTQCGHLFCSRCLPVALRTARACPTCRTNPFPRDYHPIYF